MIEKIAVLVSGILGRIKKGNLQEASESIDHAFQEGLKEDAAFFNNIPLARLNDSLIEEHNYTSGHLEILSELFYAQAELSLAQGIRNESLQYYQKSLKLLEFITAESKSFSLEKQARISSLKKRINELNIEDQPT